jgi:hypothetical protein
MGQPVDRSLGRPTFYARGPRCSTEERMGGEIGNGSPFPGVQNQEVEVGIDRPGGSVPGREHFRRLDVPVDPAGDGESRADTADRTASGDLTGGRARVTLDYCYFDGSVEIIVR